MLILSRREGEALMIGDDVTIVILGIKGHQVRVGISAPRSVNIYREEILSRLAPPEPNDAPATLLDELQAPRLRSQIRGQAYRRQHPESTGSRDDETSNSHVGAVTRTLGER